VPRQSDPAVARLLDTVFDTGDLSHGPVPDADLHLLIDWLGRLTAVGRVYIDAGRAAHDVGLFGTELGRFFDAAVAVEEAMADCMMAQLDARPGATPAPAGQRALVNVRQGIGKLFDNVIDALRAPGLTVEWVLERVAHLRASAPTMARFLLPAELARQRAKIAQLAASLHERTLRASLYNLAEALATPAPPIAAPEPEAGGAEIALDANAQGYRVSVRINGALTVKFVVDSGASVVVLPKDVVATLTGSGALAPADTLGRDTYLTADGKKHHGTRLMLRELDVGGHIVRNVEASVAPEHAEPLLGQSFLSKFKSWTLDNRRHALIIAE
jgi:clan AA aspartic protease (TIGR02281 family)